MKHYRLFLTALAAVFSLGLSAQLQDGEVYWIQDAATGQFISQGSSWGTRATVKDVGGIGFEAVKVSEGKYKLQNVMWNTMLDNSLGMRADLFTDQASEEWELTASGEGYKIGVAGGNYLSNDGTPNAIGVKDLGRTDDATAATVWKLLTRDEYDAAIQAYKDEKAATYAGLMGLSGVTSVSSLEETVTDVDQFIAKDATSSIENPTLADNWDGWTHEGAPGSNRGEGANVGSGCAEFWNGCGYATQTIEGLANGLYKVEFAGTFRPRGSGDAEKVDPEKTSSPAFVSANDASVEFVHWIDVPAKANGRSGIANNKDAYNNVLYTYVTDGTLTILVVQDAWYNGNMWCPFGQFKLTYYTDQVTDEEIEELVATIPDGVPDAVASELNSLKSSLESRKTISDYNALSQAIAEAKTLIAPYAELVAENEKAEALGVETVDYESGMTADDIIAAVQGLKVSEYEYVTENYTTEIDLGEWTKENAGDMTGQHWDGTGTSSYNEQKDGLWGSSTAWVCSYTQDIVLPAGEYVFKAAGRHSAASVLSLYVKEGSTELGSVNDFPAGDTGLGIDTSGATNFDPSGTYANGNNGRGWQWRYVPFTLDEETTITITVEGSNPTEAPYQWLSFCNYAVLAKPNVEASLAAYNQAVAAAKAAMAEYPTVTVGGEYDALKAALAADKGSTVESIDAATKAIKEATPVFSASAPSYIAYVEEKYAADNIGCPTGAAPATAEEAVEAYQTLKMNEFEYVTDNYTYDQTKLIGDFPDWDCSATVNGGEGTYNVNKGQHWSGDGSEEYYEQDGSGYGSDAWTLLFETTVSLPAGDYILKVAARASAGTTASMTCSEAAADVALPHNGASTKGIDTDGAANYGYGDFANDGNGFGWEWSYLPFSVTSERDVTFTFEATANRRSQWVSWCDLSLLSKEDVATGITNVGSENVLGAKDIFNLQGQKVGKAQKGVFIMNGKKVVVK